MSNPTLDKDVLEAAARAAGGREWFIDPRPLDNGLAYVDDGASMWPITAEWPQARFIAAANPETILSLLAEIKGLREALEKIASVSRDEVNPNLDSQHSWGNYDGVFDDGERQQAFEDAEIARAALSRVKP